MPLRHFIRFKKSKRKRPKILYIKQRKLFKLQRISSRMNLMHEMFNNRRKKSRVRSLFNIFFLKIL